MGSNKKKVSITLDEELIKSLKLLAEQNDRSLSQYINLTLKQHVQQIKNK